MDTQMRDEERVTSRVRPRIVGPGIVRAGKVRTGLAVLVVGGLAAACSNSNSGFSDPVEDMFGDPLVMMGLKVDPYEEDIEYNPRSPLVMPPNAEAQFLPTPQATTVDYGEQWPDDPDVRAKREALAMRKAAMDEKPRDIEWASQAMTPEELNEWGQKYGRQNGGGVAVGQQRIMREENKVVDPRELLDRRSDPDTAQLQAEPPRNSLTEPPTGYRTPAPKVDGGEPEEEKKGFFARMFNRD